MKADEGKYRTYDVKSGMLTDVTQFCFDGMEGMFFVVPTTKAAVGDILIVDGRPRCVIENKAGKTIRVIDYRTSSVQEIVPERHIFMGQTYFYSKIVSLFGNTLKGGDGLRKMMKFALVQQAFCGNGGLFGGSDNGGMGNMLQMTAMSQMLGGGNGGLDNLFDGLLDFSFDDIGLGIDGGDEDSDNNGEELVLTEAEREAILKARASRQNG